MPSPIPVTRLLPADFPSPQIGTCSSPLATPSRSHTLQVPAQRLHGSSVIHWKQLRAVEPVGSGGFGSVYRAEYFGQTVALKKVKKFCKNPLASRQSFWAELNAAHLRHKNIVRVLAATTCVPAEHGDAQSIGTLLMEFVGSRNLQQIIYGSLEDLPERRVLSFSEDMARGLRYLHAHRVLHLDVKPANVLVSSEDLCKLADFGCSVKLEPGTRVSQACGTYTHRAPELLRGDAVSCKADIFSCAVTVWQLLTRAPPYTGDRQHVLYAVVARQLRPSLREHALFRTERGQKWAGLLSRGWSAEITDRPEAAELLEELQSMRS